MDHLVTLYIDQLTVLYLCWACWSPRELVECNMQYECQECPMYHVYMHEPHCASMHPKIESTFHVSCILYVYALQHTSPGVAVHLPTPILPHPLLADITRLEHWERAAKYGKSPPLKIHELILKSPDNKDVRDR